MLHSAGYSDPKLPHLSVGLLQPRSPLSHSPCSDEPPPCHAHANWPALFPQCGKARLQEEQPKLWRERVRLVDDPPPEGCHALSELLPPDVGVDDVFQVCKSLTVVSRASKGAAGADDIKEHLGGVLVIRAPWGSISIFPLGGTHQHCLCRRHGYGGVIFGGNLAASVFRFSSFPADRGSASRLRASTLTPPAWLHADDARSSFSSEASWVASRCWNPFP